MCRAMAEKRHFDPELCPLLEGLSAAEIRVAMAENPHIRACAAAVTDERMDADARWATCKKSVRLAKGGGLFAQMAI